MARGLCATFRPGTSLNLGAGLGYYHQLDEPKRGGEKLSDFGAVGN
jgi:hypothetical protein